MNLLVFLPFGILIVPFIPTFLEMFRRKDKGPKDIPEQSTYEKKPEVEVSRLERARGEARAKMPGEIIRVTGNASIPDGTEIDNHLVVQGNLRLGKRCHVRGSVKTFGDIEIGEASTIEGHVLSEGKIIVGRNCIVRGIVDSLKDIILEQNAVVEAISTEKTVKLGPGAKINKRVLSGVSINTSFDQPQIQQSELIEKAEPAPQPPTKMKRPSVAIDRVQPVEKEPKFREQKPQSSAVTPEAPRSEPARLKEIERAEEPEKETERITDRIFGYLEDRIRKLDKVRRCPMEGLSLEGLSPTEIEVLKLTYVCSSIEEICLRLLKDPTQVQEILNSLIEKGYLDNDLNPKG
ncbi:MAG: hypothetical protein NWF14_08115, partial [Candidatus Bathyarchaeota archaeon]|nr:hypothetical protein [Candidatus Bathyarchaeota archaeon]